MKIIFDVTHPALVHMFRHPIRELDDRGHTVRVVSREKDVTTELLDSYGIEHEPVSAAGPNPFSRVAELLAREVAMARIARSFQPDVVVSELDPAAVHAARLVGARSIVFDDSAPERLVRALIRPFTDVICTPTAFEYDLGPHQRRYDGYHELAYLHPDRFSPDPAHLEQAGIDPEEPYFVLRFVSWSTHHDVGQRGFSTHMKRQLVRELSRYGDVYISSEGDLPPDLAEHRIPVQPAAFHDLLYYADLYVGDSQTTATEAALLGTPAIRSNSFVGPDDMSNFVELEERYGLVRSTGDEAEALETAIDLAASPLTDEWVRRRARLLTDKIDVASFVVDVVENGETA